MTTLAVNMSRKIVAFVGTIGEAALLDHQKHEQPDWPGTITNGVKHWTGVLVPNSQSLANAIGWEVFDEFCYNAFTTWGYATAADRLDKGTDGPAILQLDYETTLGPGEIGITDASARELDYRTSAGSYNGFETWVTNTVTFRYAQSRLTFTNSLGKVTLRRMTQAYQELNP